MCTKWLIKENTSLKTILQDHKEHDGKVQGDEK